MSRGAKTNLPKIVTELSLFLLFLSSHNWNTLFLGSNAVADAMAKKYGAEKSAILDNVSLRSSIK